MINATKTTLQQFIDAANKEHNYFYSYDNVIYINTKTRVIITCPIHGNFNQQPDNHLRGNGCPACSSNVSKYETQWLDELGITIRNKIIIIDNKTYKPDGYDPVTNTIYEFDGDYWHGNPVIFSPDKLNKKVKKTFGELYDKTIQKQNHLRSAGYNVVSIWESEYLNNLNS